MSWTSMIKEGDTEGLWNSLHELVSRYLLGLELAHGRREALPVDLNALLTQELFLELIAKHRFERYIESGYTSAEIERELLVVEIPCLILLRFNDPAFGTF